MEVLWDKYFLAALSSSRSTVGTKLKNSNCEKLKNSNCDKTKKNLNCDKLKSSNCDKTAKLKL